MGFYLTKITSAVNGVGGVPDLGMVKIECYAVSKRGGSQLPDAFYRIKNIFPV